MTTNRSNELGSETGETTMAERKPEAFHQYGPEEIKEIQADPELREHFETAERVTSEAGEQNLRDWYFRHEVAEDIQQALDRLNG